MTSFTNTRLVPIRRHLAGSLAAVGVVSIMLGACGSGDDGAASAGLASASPSAAVCDGEPSDVNPPSSAPFSAYTYVDGGDGWRVGWSTVFGDQRAIVGDDATAILCARVVESTEVERCDYEEDGESFTLVLVDATYEMELRNADTASVVARDSFSVVAPDCPFVVSWTPGEGERTSFPTPDAEQIERSLGPFVG